MSDALVILAAVVIGACIVLAAVALGGLLVYRTKRESYEAFLGGKAAPEGTIIQSDPFQASSQEAPERAAFHSMADAAQEAVVAPIVETQNTRFLRQFLTDKARGANA